MTPRDISQECAFASLRRASRAVGHLYDLVDTPTRLKVTQLTMLRSIADAGEIAHCDLARQAIGSEETFSRRLASARKQGWVSMRVYGSGGTSVLESFDPDHRLGDCCSSDVIVKRFRWQGNRFEPIGVPGHRAIAAP